MIHLDKVASFIEFGEVTEAISRYLHWHKKNISEVSLEEFKNWLGVTWPKNETLNNLSFPQLIVLYGKMWEKELKPEHLKEIEELLK